MPIQERITALSVKKSISPSATDSSVSSRSQKLAQLTRLATVPEQVTHSGALPVNTPRQWAFPSVNGLFPP